MGGRAGEAFDRTGLPQRNPFRGRADLAAVWRSGYFAGLRVARRRRRSSRTP